MSIPSGSINFKLFTPKDWLTKEEKMFHVSEILAACTTVVVAYFILSRLLYLAYSVNLGLLCMPHPGMGTLV